MKPQLKIAPPLPNAEAADAVHFQLDIHECWGESHTEDLLATLAGVERQNAKSWIGQEQGFMISDIYTKGAI